MINRRALLLTSLALTPVRALDFDALPVTIILPPQQNLLFALITAMVNGNYFRGTGLEVILTQRENYKDQLNDRPLTLAITDINAFLSNFNKEKLIYVVSDQFSGAIIGRKSRGITENINSLKGKILGAPQNNYYLSAILKQAGMTSDNLAIEAIGANLREPMLANGEVDAIIGSPAVLVPSLKAKNVPLDDVITLNFNSLNAPFYGFGLIANDKSLTEHVEPLARLKAAMTKALMSFQTDALPVAQVLMRRVEGLSAELALEQAQYYISESVFTPFMREKGLGSFDQSRLEKIAKLLEIKPPTGFLP